MSKKTILGLIPARSGSKGIPGKNIKPLGGVPLIGWASRQAKKSKLMDKLVLSTDSSKIAETAARFGVEAPFFRPSELAADDTLVIEVIRHALNWFSSKGTNYDYVCLVQPTAPFAVTEDYDRAISLAIENDADTVVSIYPCDQRHPAIMFTKSEDNRAEFFLKDKKQGQVRRQDLPPVYLRSGIAYVFKSSMILEQNTLYGEKIFANEVPEMRSLDIDSPHDLVYAEFLLKERLVDIGQD